MATNLRIFNTLAEYEAEKEAHTLDLPNVALIKSPYKQIKYLQTNPEVGVGICAIVNGNRAYYTIEEWDEMETKPTVVVGVYVKAPYMAGFVIHPTARTTKAWSNTTNVVVQGVTTTASQAAALLDYAGKTNTESVLSAVDSGVIADAPAFTWLNTDVTFPDGATPYIPAAGELNLIYLNQDQVNSCLAAISGTAVSFAKNIWTSTQYSAAYAWNWTSTKWYTYYKYYTSYSVLPVCSL